MVPHDRMAGSPRPGRTDSSAAARDNYPRISPDGTKILVDSRDQDLDVWTWDLTGKTLTRVTFGEGMDWTPIWTPDGRRLVFSSTPPEPPDLYWQAADGTGMPERLAMSSHGQFPSCLFT